MDLRVSRHAYPRTYAIGSIVPALAQNTRKRHPNIGDVDAIKKPRHPASKWMLCGYSGLRVFLFRPSIHDSEEMVGEQDDL